MAQWGPGERDEDERTAGKKGKYERSERVKRTCVCQRDINKDTMRARTAQAIIDSTISVS